MPAGFIDITVPISDDLPVWPGDEPVRVGSSARIAAGDPANVSRLSLSAHAGTHVDAPLHYIDGAIGVDELPIDRLIGPCYVADVTETRSTIEAEDLNGAGIPLETRRLLLKTPNARRWSGPVPRFDERFTALDPSAARWITGRGIELVGIDAFSIEPFTSAGDVHRHLLQAGVIIVETLDLRAVSPGVYTLVCLPLKVHADGSPCRAILVTP